MTDQPGSGSRLRNLLLFLPPCASPRLPRPPVTCFPPLLARPGCGPLSRSPRPSRGAVGDTHPAVRSCWTLSSRSRSVSSIFPATPGCEGQRRREERGWGSAELPPPVPPPLSPPLPFRPSRLSLCLQAELGAVGFVGGSRALRSTSPLVRG